MAGNLTTQGLRNLTGKQDGFDVCSMMLDTVLGGVGGKAGELLERGAAALGKKLAGKARTAAAGAEDDAARQVANGVDDVAKKPGIAENGARGRASEKRALEDMGLSKNTSKVTTQ